MKSLKLKINLTLISFLSLLLLSSCEQIVDIELGDYPTTPSPKLLLRPSAEQFLFLGWAGGLNETEEFELPDNAIITITDQDGISQSINFFSTIEGSFQGYMYGDYECIYKPALLFPTPGNKYDLKIELPNYPVITSSITYPTQPTDLNVTINSVVEDPEEGGYMVSTDVSFTSASNETEYYELIAYSSELDTVEISSLGLQYLEPLNEYILGFESNSLSNNEDEWRETILFNDAAFSGDDISFNFKLKVWSNYDNGEYVLPTIAVELRHVTESYYHYIRSLRKQEQVANDPFSEPVLVYNNIINGKGIFSGYSNKFVVLEP